MNIKNILLKIKELLKSLWKSVLKQREPSTVVEQAPIESPVEIKPEEPPMVAPTAPEAIPEVQEEPDTTDPTSMVTSFLWKPLSDTNPKVTVVTVACDGIRSEHLFMEVLDSQDVLLAGKTSKNQWSERGNKLPGCKFGRVNFKPGPTAAKYAKSQPLKVRFFVMLDNVRTDVTIQGKPLATIKDATVRWVMHGGKMSIDIKK